MVFKTKKKTSKKATKTKQQIKNIAKQVIQSEAESKYFDAGAPLRNMTSTGECLQLTGVSQAAGASGPTVRIGEKIKATSVLIRCVIAASPTAGQYDLCRIMVVASKEDTGTVPSISNIVSNGYGGYAVSPLNPVNSKRFTVLRDKIFTMQNGINNQKYIRFYIPYKRIVTFADANTTPRANHLYIVLASTNGTSNYPTCFVNSRFRFIDL